MEEGMKERSPSLPEPSGDRYCHVDVVACQDLRAGVCALERHHDQPQSTQHEQYDGWNQVLAYRNPVEYAPYHTGNDHQIDQNIQRVDFEARHDGWLKIP